MKVSLQFFVKMVRYERLDGNEEEGGEGGRGGAGSVKRNLLIVLIALALFATILGNFFPSNSTRLKKLSMYGHKRILSFPPVN